VYARTAKQLFFETLVIMFVQLFVICLGPICIPIWGLFPIVLVFLQKCWAKFVKGEKVNFFSSTSSSKSNDDGSNASSEITSLHGEKRYTGVIVPETSEKYYEIIKSSETLVVVDFTASWCGPCQKIKPVFHKFATEYNAEFLQVDVDEFDKIAQKAKVNAMPTFQFYANGNKVDELVGASEEELRQLIQKYVGKSKKS
jgi:thioredoxin 1